MVISLRAYKVGYHLQNAIRSNQYCIVFWIFWSKCRRIIIFPWHTVYKWTLKIIITSTGRHTNLVHPRRLFIRAGFELLMQRGFLISLRSRGAVAWGYAVVSATRTGEVLNFKRALPNRFSSLYYTRAHRERA